MSTSPTLPPVGTPPRHPTPFPGVNVESDARLQAALAASARAEASLNGLFRALQNLDGGVGGAQAANEALTHDLESLREMLSLASEQQQSFKQKLALLEEALDRARQEHARERTFLIEQQDTFIVNLLDDQEVVLKSREKELEVLRDRIAELERRGAPTVPPPAAAPRIAPSSPSAASSPAHSSPVKRTPSANPPLDFERAERAELERTAQKLADDRERAREAVQRLQMQRDEAQGAVARISKERDEALQEVHRLKAELGGPRISTRRPPADFPFGDSTPFPVPTSPVAAGSEPSLPRVSSSNPAISSVLSPPRSSPNAAPLSTRLSPVPARLSPPPEELRAALTHPPHSSSSGSQKALKQKPDASTRPLVGYSLGNESVEAEHLEGVRLSSKPAGTK